MYLWGACYPDNNNEMEMRKLLCALAVLNFHGASAVLYSINETEYARMPPLYELDEYETCLREPGAAYCMLDADLFAETPSELLQLIHEYSDYSLKHFNHTQIHRGICATRTCADYIKPHSSNTTNDLKLSLGACLNHTIWLKYNLQVKVASIRYCDRHSDSIQVDGADILVAVIYLILAVMNIVGSYYDLWLNKKGNNGVQGNSYLLAFSLRRNWAKLTSAADESSDPRKKRLKAIHGLRSMTLICVLFSHTVLIISHSYVENPLYIEKAYDDPLKQILFNGSLVIQTFFVMSSFLLAYNYQIFAESHQFSFWHLPKGLLNRWLRLTPTYGLVLGTISTWMRHLGRGPQWRLVVGSEAEACRQYWWSHLLYINNYVYDNAYCMPQTWYLAADTQLFFGGLALATAGWRLGSRGRNWLLAAALLAGVLAPAAHTYLQDLDAVVLQSPETYRNLYARDDTFRTVYTRGHTNLGGYALGLMGGYLFYRWQVKADDMDGYKRYRYAHWCLFPLGVAVILTGGVFYVDGGRAQLAARVVYAALYKNVFALLVVCLMLGTFLKVETVYRGIVEWRGWRVCGRVSYCAFLVHTLLQRGFVGAAARPIYMTDYFILVILSSTIFLTMICAVLLCLAVEMPLSHLQRHLLEAPRTVSPHHRTLAANVSLVLGDNQPTLRSKL